MSVDILASALKHGLSMADVIHAVEHSVAVEEVGEDPSRFLVLGPDWHGNLLEVVVLDRPNGPCAIHAMKMRESYRRLLTRGGTNDD